MGTVRSLPAQEIVIIDMPDAFGFEQMLDEACLCRQKGSWHPQCPFGIHHNIEAFRPHHHVQSGAGQRGLVMKFPEDIPHYATENTVDVTEDGRPIFDSYYEASNRWDGDREGETVEVAPVLGDHYVREGNNIVGHFSLTWHPHNDPPTVVTIDDQRTVFPTPNKPAGGISDWRY